MSRRSVSEKEIVCNLRSTKFDLNVDLKSQVFNFLDQFFYPLLYRQNVRAIIIVGKGLRSKRLIDGYHPLKYYTIKYCQTTGLVWRTGEAFNNDTGQIIIDF